MNMKKYLLFFIVLFFLLIVFIVPANAANLQDAFGGDNYLQKAGGVGGAGYIEGNTPALFIGAIIQTALTFLGVIFLILMIYGGYLWMTARGNEEQSGKAKNTIVAAIIGIVIVLSAYAISYLVIEKLGSKALDSSNSTIEAIEIIS
ncbi:hypothetical protein L6267_02785 [Candidatus Parcubacteria bacterium]|nr:hypothetical protein [Candidatus Parcubacteria bacterium]